MITLTPRTPSRIPSSTLGDVVDSDRTGVRVRRVSTAVVVLVVLAGALGFAGVRQGVVRAHGGDLTMAVQYPTVGRPGVDAAFAITLTRPGGLGDDTDPVRVTLDRRYLDLWESQRFWPEPSSETAEGDRVVLEFDAPDGDTMTIRYDAYLQPVAQRGGSGSVTAEAGGDSATASFTTTLLP